MQRAAINSRLLMDLFSSRKVTGIPKVPGRAGLYHRNAVSRVLEALANGKTHSYCADRLVWIAERAYLFRSIEAVEQASDLLLSLPLPTRYLSVGAYFRALCVRESEPFGLRRSTALLEGVANNAGPKYKARALLSLGTNAARMGDRQSQLKLYADAGRVAGTDWCDPVTVFQAQKMLAVLKGTNGYNRSALSDLENLYPLARRVGSWYPHVYYDYLNSFAVELGEAGRLEEAANASILVVASPFANAYPEWSETRDSIAQRGRCASRSFVAAHSPQPANDSAAATIHTDTSLANPYQPEIANSPALRRPQPADDSPARLLVFPDRKAQLTESSASSRQPQPSAQPLAEMTEFEKRTLVAKLFLDERTPTKVFDRMLEAAGFAVPDQRDDAGPRHLDLESPGELEDLIRRWVNGAVDPDELAAVLSALRDCEDERRRTNILDQMIGYAFTETVQHHETESDWRRRVEARLTPNPDDLYLA